MELAASETADGTVGEEDLRRKSNGGHCRGIAVERSSKAGFGLEFLSVGEYQP